jgi:hypothetical protein
VLFPAILVYTQQIKTILNKETLLKRSSFTKILEVFPGPAQEDR